MTNKRTPWGMSQDVTVVADGVEFHSTPTHGGYWVSAERRKRMPNWMPRQAWYEEDCEWAFVCLAFPDLFDSGEKAVNHARQTIAHWYPALAPYVYTH
jgi:hypothetical protein